MPADTMPVDAARHSNFFTFHILNFKFISVLAGKSSNLAPFPFIRALHWPVHPLGCFQSFLLACILTLPDACFCLLIEQLCFPGRSSPAWHGLDNHHKLKFAAPDSQLVTGLHYSGWFDPGPINMDLAPGNSLRCHWTGLEKSCGPKPLIDSNFIFSHFILQKVHPK